MVKKPTKNSEEQTASGRSDEWKVVLSVTAVVALISWIFTRHYELVAVPGSSDSNEMAYRIETRTGEAWVLRSN